MKYSRDRTVLFTAFDGMGLLDFSGPLTVFRSASWLLRRRHQNGYDCHVTTMDGGPVMLWEGITVMSKPLRRFAGRADTIVVPGGLPADGMLADRRLVAWLAKHGGAARRVCSVCSGAYLLAEAGFLNGRRAVTHWQECHNLEKRYPAVQVEPDAIFVQDGPVWTSAGVSAGIDLALALVQEDHGRQLAMQIARQLVVFMKRPGGQSQFSTFLEAQSADADPFAPLHEWLLKHLGDPDLTVEDLADQAGMSLRNFSRLYRKKTGRTPAKEIELFRLEAARRLLEETDARIDSIARQTGFGDEERMRRTFQRHLNVSPQQYRERFGHHESRLPPPYARPSDQQTARLLQVV